MTRRVAIVAGEASGDLLGASLVRAVLARFPGTRFYGIAGPRMVAAGAETLVPMEKLSVRGYVEALKSLPELLRLRANLASRLAADRPDLFIGIDAPDFNLGLERKLKRAGIPTVHYVSPSIWAWRAGRLPAIGRAVDRVLTIFPFEDAIYAAAGIASTYVGHPLADQIPLDPDRGDAREQLRLAESASAVALLPGSRRGELESHADLFIDTARRLAVRRPGTRFFVPLATRETRDYFESRLYAREALGLDLTILFGHARLALQAADAALIASGTATLEGALARCPMVITYKVPALTYRIMMRKPLLPYVGLPNILAGEFIVPELLQDHATPENLEQALANWLDHKVARERLQARYAAIHGELRCDNDARVVQALAPYLEGAEKGSVPFSAFSRLCGVDEAGRGPLAGAVFAAAVVLDPRRPVPGLADSKLLDPARREKLAVAIRRDALAWAIATATVEEIDDLNILRASLAAMARALAALGLDPDEVLVDGLHVPSTPFPCRAIVKGDRLVPAISAASILAKTARDEEMVALDARFPGYGFARHKGYPTADHLEALRLLGPCEIHRRTFAPVRAEVARREAALRTP